MAAAQRFSNLVQDSQKVFRAAMMAMSRPGTLHELDVAPDAPAPLMPAAAALALALADFETPVWLDAKLIASPEVARWLRFETGAPLTEEAAKAQFALIANAPEIPNLDRFAIGTLDYPDRSTTLIIQVAELSCDVGWTLSGPGIIGQTRLHAGPLREASLVQISQTRLIYPRGVDIFFCCGRTIAALPRSVLIEE